MNNNASGQHKSFTNIETSHRRSWPKGFVYFRLNGFQASLLPIFFPQRAEYMKEFTLHQLWRKTSPIRDAPLSRSARRRLIHSVRIALPQPRTQASSRYPRWRHIRNRWGRLGTRLALPQPFSCVNRHPVRCDFSCSAKAFLFNVNIVILVSLLSKPNPLATLCAFLLSHLFAEKKALAFIPAFEKSFKFLESGRERRPIKLLLYLILYY